MALGPMPTASWAVTYGMLIKKEQGWSGLWVNLHGILKSVQGIGAALQPHAGMAMNSTVSGSSSQALHPVINFV